MCGLDFRSSIDANALAALKRWDQKDQFYICMLLSSLAQRWNCAKYGELKKMCDSWHSYQKSCDLCLSLSLSHGKMFHCVRQMLHFQWKKLYFLPWNSFWSHCQEFKNCPVAKNSTSNTENWVIVLTESFRWWMLQT